MAPGLLFCPAAMIQKKSPSIHGRAGFTLIEMVIILAIAGLVLILGAPTLMNLIHRSRIEGSAQQVAVLVRQTRYEAIKRSAALEVRVSDEKTAATAFGPMVRLATGVKFDVTLGGCVESLTLEPSGGASSVGSFCLSDMYGNQMKVEVRPRATAQVRLLKNQNGEFRAQGQGGQAWQFN